MRSSLKLRPLLFTGLLVASLVPDHAALAERARCSRAFRPLSDWGLEARVLQTAAPSRVAVEQRKLGRIDAQLERAVPVLQVDSGKVLAAEALVASNPRAKALARDTETLHRAFVAYRKEVSRMQGLNTKANHLQGEIDTQSVGKINALWTSYRTLYEQYRSYYGFNLLPGQGEGQTIAIIDTGSSPTLMADYNAFGAALDLPNTAGSLTVRYVTSAANASGYSTAADASFYTPGWDSEAHLDVEWAHAMAPYAKILYVSSTTNDFEGMAAAIKYALDQGATQVSMSFAFQEGSWETQYDSLFADHPNVTFYAATGDWGSGTSYPAANPNVVAVGGTSLTFGAKGSATETAWNDTGGGVSLFEPRGAYQAGVPGDPAYRTESDLSANASGAGYPIFNSNPADTQFAAGSPWLSFWGTSASTPLVAAGFADLNSSLGRNFTGGPASLYQLHGGFRDITSGSDAAPSFSGSSYTSTNPVNSTRFNLQSATVGYDAPTGLGSPEFGALKELLLLAPPGSGRVPVRSSSRVRPAERIGINRS